jgi:hypothetical protein
MESHATILILLLADMILSDLYEATMVNCASFLQVLGFENVHYE